MNLQYHSKYRGKITEAIAMQMMRKKFMSSGVSAHYVKLSNFVGVKIFKNRAQRDGTLTKQSLAAAKGLAPQVGDPFTFELWIPIAQTEIHFDCFIVEHIIVPIPLKWRPVKGTTYRCKETILKELRKLGLHTTDTHSMNWGVRKKQLYFIDFDSVTMQYRKPK